MSNPRRVILGCIGLLLFYLDDGEARAVTLDASTPA